jgi:Domain of unknown function (DUF222)/HNH endonuclease
MFESIGLFEEIHEVRAVLGELDDASLFSVAFDIEVAGRRLAALGLDVVAELATRGHGTAKLPRLRTALANELSISAREAGARIRAAGDLAGLAPRLPEAAIAARDGALSAESMRVITETIAKLPDDADAADIASFDAELTVCGIGERPEVLRRDAAAMLADYDAGRPHPEQRARARAARRGVSLGPQQADGMSRVDGWIDPEARAYLEAVLAKAARPGMCNPNDPVATVDGDPEPVMARSDDRTQCQRNHDALKTCWRMSLASGEWGQHRGLPVTTVVTMTLQQLEAGAGVAVTGGGSTVPVEVALRMAAHSHHYLYLYDENSGRPMFLGRSKRLASADQRIVLHAIDGGCTAPGCDQPAYNCDVHHVIEWSDMGTTDIDRLTLLCQQNHKHAGQAEEQWLARRRFDEDSLGQALWFPPKSVDTQRRPRANRHHRRPRPPAGEAA